MTIGDRIKLKREELNMTQEELATKLGYKSRSSINKMEIARDLPLKKVTKMAQVLGVSPSYLMGWADENDNDLLNNYDQRILSYYKALSPENQETATKYLEFLKAQQDIEGK